MKPRVVASGDPPHAGISSVSEEPPNSRLSSIVNFVESLFQTMESSDTSDAEVRASLGSCTDVPRRKARAQSCAAPRALDAHRSAIMAPSELDPPGMSDDFYRTSVVTLTTHIDDARNRIAASSTEHLNQLRRKVEVDVEWMKKETEARFVHLECEAKEARELIATLRAELTNAEKKEAMAVAEARKARAELDELRDSVQSGKEPLRAELEMWKESSRKYRKKLEHSEQALARLKARAGAAGFVEATPPHHHASAFRPHAKRVRMEETRNLAAEAPAPSPPRQADPAAPESNADPSPPDVDPTLAQMPAPAVPDPGARWRRKGGGTAGGGTAGGGQAGLAPTPPPPRGNRRWDATPAPAALAPPPAFPKP